MAHKGAHDDLTAEFVRSILDYDPDTGIFRWKVDGNNQYVRTGRQAGAARDGKRIKIGIHDTEYMAHRLAWLFMTGEWPPFEIDHKDLNGLNNKWDNIRRATPSQNQSNRPRRRNNISGVTGVCFDNKRQNWIAYINKRHIAHYPTFDEAISARLDAVARIHKEFAYRD